MTLLSKISQWCFDNQNRGQPAKKRVLVHTVDNPGWWISADLVGTPFEEKKMEWFDSPRGEEDWLFCGVRECTFDCSSDPMRFSEGLAIFVAWIANAGEVDAANLSAVQSESADTSPFGQLQSWYFAECDGDWEHSFGVQFDTMGGDSGWRGEINVEETELEDLEFWPVERQSDSRNWLRCSVSKNKFVFECGTLQLEDCIEIFVDWAEKWKP